ncbi:hypothetical protein BHM03_00042394 [Ensete ventricosum]|nr:hypothetical protein BHM03_00042394 [Ensete ventricosum]
MAWPPARRRRLATARASPQGRPKALTRGGRRRRPPARAAPRGRSVAHKGCRVSPVAVALAYGLFAEGRRPWRCRPWERSQS